MTTELTLPEPGTIVADKYRVERVIGQGGMGAVFAATHTVTGKRVALKWLLPQLALDAQAAARFIREAQAAARIEHPNVIDVYDVGQHGGALFLVMEMLRGESLSERIERGALTVPEAVRIVLPVLKALGAAHRQGIVHRDVKPDNIFLARVEDGAEEVPKVLDFGISKLGQGFPISPDSQLTKTGVVMGTPHYMAPEQLLGAKHVDARADIYAMGVVLYQALSKELPHDADSYGELVLKVNTVEPRPLHELREDLPPSLSKVVERALARDPDARYPDVQSLAEDLAPFASEAGSIPSVTKTACPVSASVEGGGTDPSAATFLSAEVQQARTRDRTLVLTFGGLLIALLLVVVVGVFLLMRAMNGEEQLAGAPTSLKAPQERERRPEPEDNSDPESAADPDNEPGAASASAAGIEPAPAPAPEADTASTHRAETASGSANVPRDKRSRPRGTLRRILREEDSRPDPVLDPEPVPKPEPAVVPLPRAPGQPSGPVLSKDEAKAVLEPKVLQCMQRAGVHYLITRVGQGYKAKETGPLAPVSVLGDPEPNYVDYRHVKGFKSTPLARCIDRAAAAIRVRAFRGDYIYFGVRNPKVPDPLEGLPPRVDQKAAEAALLDHDDAARECVRRHPDEATPGKKIQLLVVFTGFDGKVTKVDPYYMDNKSAFTRCIVAAYSKAMVKKFRGLSDKVLHHLQL